MFDRLVVSYQSFILSHTEVNREDIVNNRLEEGSIIDFEEENEGKNNFNKFTKYLKIYSDLDEQIFRIYKNDNVRANWLSRDTTMNSFFASVADSTCSEDNINIALEKLIMILKDSYESDPIGIGIISNILDKLNSRKVNIGFETRKLIRNGFVSYFKGKGEVPLSECWGGVNN